MRENMGFLSHPSSRRTKDVLSERERSEWNMRSHAVWWFYAGTPTKTFLSLYTPLVVESFSLPPKSLFIHSKKDLFMHFDRAAAHLKTPPPKDSKFQISRAHRHPPPCNAISLPMYFVLLWLKKLYRPSNRNARTKKKLCFLYSRRRWNVNNS